MKTPEQLLMDLVVTLFYQHPDPHPIYFIVYLNGVHSLHQIQLKLILQLWYKCNLNNLDPNVMVVNSPAEEFNAGTGTGYQMFDNPDRKKRHAEMLNQNLTFNSQTTAVCSCFFLFLDQWHLYWEGKNSIGLTSSLIWVLPLAEVSRSRHWPITYKD